MVEVQDENPRLWDSARVCGGESSIKSLWRCEDEFGLSYSKVVSQLVSCVTWICAREAPSRPNDAEEQAGIVDLNRYEHEEREKSKSEYAHR
jgi:hypothetical protein